MRLVRDIHRVLGDWIAEHPAITEQEIASAEMTDRLVALPASRWAEMGRARKPLTSVRRSPRGSCCSSRGSSMPIHTGYEFARDTDEFIRIEREFAACEQAQAEQMRAFISDLQARGIKRDEPVAHSASERGKCWAGGCRAPAARRSVGRLGLSCGWEFRSHLLVISRESDLIPPQQFTARRTACPRW